jgi:hypothetical protein
MFEEGIDTKKTCAGVGERAQKIRVKTIILYTSIVKYGIIWT